jgi:hypothetical protein
VIVWQKFFTSSNPSQTVTTYGRRVVVDNSASCLYVIFQESLNWNDFVGFTIVKLDLSGNIIWQKLFNSLSVENCIGLSVSGGDVYISGLTAYSPTGELYLAKLDSLGNWVWGKSIAASTYNRQAGPTAVDSTGNVIVVGGFSAPALFKFDPLGNLIWRASTPTIISMFVVGMVQVLDSLCRWTPQEIIAGEPPKVIWEGVTEATSP